MIYTGSFFPRAALYGLGLPFGRIFFLLKNMATLHPLVVDHYIIAAFGTFKSHKGNSCDFAPASFGLAISQKRRPSVGTERQLLSFLSGFLIIISYKNQQFHSVCTILLSKWIFYRCPTHLRKDAGDEQDKTIGNAQISLAFSFCLQSIIKCSLPIKFYHTAPTNASCIYRLLLHLWMQTILK